MTQAQKTIKFRWDAPYFKELSTISIICEILNPDGIIEKIFLNPNKTLEKSVSVSGLYFCEARFPSSKLIRQRFILREEEASKEIVIKDTDDIVKQQAIYLHKFLGTYHQSSLNLNTTEMANNQRLFSDSVEKLWFRLWTFGGSQPKPLWIPHKPKVNNFSIKSYEDAMLISLSALPQNQLCYFELGEQRHFSRFIAIPPVKEAQAIICRSLNPTTINTGLSLKFISTDPSHGEIQSVLYYLKQGYFEAAEDIVGKILQNLDNANIDPFTITILNYFLLKTKKVDQLDNIDFIIKNLCQQYSWLPDSAIIYAWYLIDIGEKKSGFNNRENYINKIKELLLKAFHCGVPLFSQGFRFLFEKIRQLEMQLPDDNELKEGLSHAAMLLGQRLSASYEEDPLTSFFGINPGYPTMDIEVLSTLKSTDKPSDSVFIKERNEQNKKSQQSKLNSKELVSSSQKSHTLSTNQRSRKTFKSSKQRTRSSRNKTRKNIPNGIAHIQSTFNNTMVTISDTKGDVVTWASAGSSGFKGAKKGTPFAAQTAADKAGRKAMDQGMRQLEVMISGPGAGRETAIRALQGVGLEITLIRDVTPIPHNGCRPPKRRRV